MQLSRLSGLFGFFSLFSLFGFFGLSGLFGFVNHLSFGWNGVDNHDWNLLPLGGTGSEPSARTLLVSLVCLVSIVF
jgi:hypothetical protein